MGSYRQAIELHPSPQFSNMKKNYTNFKVVDDSVAMKQEQTPSKTNYEGLEAIRKEQMKGRIERPIAVSSTVTVMTNQNFNEWTQHINNLITQSDGKKTTS